MSLSLISNVTRQCVFEANFLQRGSYFCSVLHVFLSITVTLYSPVIVEIRWQEEQ